jgi:hypothetical protein
MQLARGKSEDADAYVQLSDSTIFKVLAFSASVADPHSFFANPDPGKNLSADLQNFANGIPWK